MPTNDPRFDYHAQAILNLNESGVQSKFEKPNSETHEKALSHSDTPFDQAPNELDQSQQFQNPLNRSTHNYGKFLFPKILNFIKNT